MTTQEKKNIYNAIQNLYNMDFTTWQEVLAMLYNLVADAEQKFEKLEAKFTLMLGKEVTEAIKKMHESGELAEIINQEIFSDLNNKIDEIKVSVLSVLTTEIGRVDKEIEKVNEELDTNTKNIDGILNLEYYRFLVTDNDWTTALQTALNTGKNIEISRLYNVKSVTLSGEKQSIYGHGRNCGLIAIDGTQPTLLIKGNANTISNLSFNTTISSNNEDFSAIKCLNSTHTIIENIYCTGSFYKTINLNNAIYCSLKDSYIGGGKVNLININGGTYTRIKDCMIHQPDTTSTNCVALINITEAPSVYIERCHITRGKGIGIKSYADPNNYSNTYLVIKDCDIDNSDNDGINIDGYWNVHISDNWISTCRDSGKKSIYLKNCKKIYIENNDCYASNQGYGIYLESCNGGTVAKNTSEHHIFCIKTLTCSNINIINNSVCAVTALPSFGTANARAFEDDGNSTTCKWYDNILVNPTQLENYQGIREDRIRHLGTPRITRPTLQNSWTNVEYRGIGYYIDSSKVVHLFGQATGGLSTTTVFTLPPGFRPGTTKLFKDNNGNNISVLDNGNVQFNTSNAVNLNGISFLSGEY